MLIADGSSRIELEEPRRALEAAGARVELVAPRHGEVHVMDHLEKAGTVPVDRALIDADPARYAALVLPGGVAGTDHLRRDPDAVALIADFVAQGRLVAAICHAPWLLIEAGLIRGRTLTSWPSLRTDILNAGGRWVDEEVHREGDVITSRKPSDLPAFCAAIIGALEEGGHGGRAEPEPAPVPARASVPTAAGTRVLILAHRTAATPRLLDAVRERAGRGECSFTLLIPRPYWDPDTEETAATFELVLPLLERAAGGHVEGIVGASEPLQAVRETLASDAYDEVIVSTLPAHVSRWLHMDLPHRIGQLGVPVTVISAE